MSSDLVWIAIFRSLEHFDHSAPDVTEHTDRLLPLFATHRRSRSPVVSVGRLGFREV